MHVDEVRSFWAKVLGIPGSHWMIVMALQRLDHRQGAHVHTIADMLGMNPTFVTSQSRLLERKGLVRATLARADDSVAIVFSLTSEARRHLAELNLLQKR